MNEQPLVSIVIPAYSARFFAVALQSAVGQSYENLEVLVCDDSEGDEIETILIEGDYQKILDQCADRVEEWNESEKDS